MVQSILGRSDLISFSTKVSFADGAAVTMINKKIRKILTQNLDFVANVEEREIIQSLLDLESEGIFVEGAAALSLAGLSRLAQVQKGNLPKNIVLVLTGKI